MQVPRAAFTDSPYKVFLVGGTRTLATDTFHPISSFPRRPRHDSRGNCIRPTSIVKRSVFIRQNHSLLGRYYAGYFIPYAIHVYGQASLFLGATPESRQSLFYHYRYFAPGNHTSSVIPANADPMPCRRASPLRGLPPLTRLRVAPFRLFKPCW